MTDSTRATHYLAVLLTLVAMAVGLDAVGSTGLIKSTPKACPPAANAVPGSERHLGAHSGKLNDTAVSGSHQPGPRSSDVARRVTPSTRGTAISLRELCLNLNDSHAKTLFEVTRVHGYIMARDSRGSDVILITSKRTGRPSLRLDDLVVAWRCLSSGDKKPACTIDPRPSVMRKMSAVGSRIATCPGKSELTRLLEQWHSLATELQDVQVFSVPSHNHFARTMVMADYHLKSVANGAERLDGVTSLVDQILETLRKQIGEEGRVSIPVSMSNRFWFNPGPIRLVHSNGTFLIEMCEVVLLTEEEALTPGGRLQSTGQANPYAKEFANSFTQAYSDVTIQRPIYGELENLYRWVAIVDSILDSETNREAQAVLGNLARWTRVEHFTCPKALPGKSGLHTIEQPNCTTGNLVHHTLYLPSCGGVSMAVDVKPSDVTHDTTGQVANCRLAAIGARPSAKSVHWEFRMSPGGQDPKTRNGILSLPRYLQRDEDRVLSSNGASTTEHSVHCVAPAEGLAELPCAGFVGPAGSQ